MESLDAALRHWGTTEPPSLSPELVEIRVPSAKRGDLVVMIPFLIDADQG
eukprot:CAMPEP_0179452258 /NCGR_PEP_ID=MMETSP0799-20121207/36149_1 /TAXON_ID=46947 /ORGANISM="Geminigera cryophila, Strain CCMP2564" /LENGTH=49 /DNA_ID= /DNA_START= /DNA_END= /DNA_ORIENTATION=